MCIRDRYRHKWQVGDIVIWDNRCALHSATGGYPIEQKRIHWRCTIMQDQAAAQRAAWSTRHTFYTYGAARGMRPAVALPAGRPRRVDRLTGQRRRAR